jgi:Ribonuclease G/E
VLLVERQWGSLESIFLGSADIRSQLPEDSRRFEVVDVKFKEFLIDIQAKPTVIAACTAGDRERVLKGMFKELEKCERALNEYLEVKKGIFPRFYFVSNAALLDILSNGNNPPKIMPHVGSVFDGIGDLELCPSNDQAKLLKSLSEESAGDEEDPEEVEDPKPRFKTKAMRAYKIQEVIKKRQVILVQVVKDERGGKGAALTTYLSLPGRYCVLMPNTPRGSGISRKISDAEDRKHLKELVEGLNVVEGAGLIVRTAGLGRTKLEIKRDYDYLMRLWEEIREKTLQSQAPSVIYEEGNLITKAIRDLYGKDIE